MGRAEGELDNVYCLLFTAVYRLLLTGYGLLLEGDRDTVEPGGLELKCGRGTAGGVDGTGKGGHTVAFERDIGDGLGDEHIVAGIKGLNGDGHRLLVAIEEGKTGDGNRGSCHRRRIVGLGETVVGESKTRGGVEALAAFGVGGADLGGISRTAIGGDDPQA